MTSTQTTAPQSVEHAPQRASFAIDMSDHPGVFADCFGASSLGYQPSSRDRRIQEKARHVRSGERHWGRVQGR